MRTYSNTIVWSALLACMPLVGCAVPDESGEDAEHFEEQQAFDAPTAPVQAPVVTTADAATCSVPIPPSLRCNDRLAPGDERTCTINGRPMIVRAGKSMNPCKPTALVIDLHGEAGNMRQARGIERYCNFGVCWDGVGSGWAAESDAPDAGFVTVFPQAGPGGWGAGDTRFLVGVVEEMKKVANIDAEQVILNGISQSANAVSQIACARTDVFRKISLNAGGLNCPRQRRPASAILFSAKPDLNHARSQNALATIVRNNRCRGEAKPWKIVDGATSEPLCKSRENDPQATLVPCSSVTGVRLQPTLCKIWDDCAEGTKVVSCEVPANTSHGALLAPYDAQLIYENDTYLNTPSLAYRFFTGAL